MLEREMKINFKNFIIWTVTLVLVFFVVYLMYPSIINSDNIKMIDEMMKIFPEEVLKSLNMDLSSIDSAFGWLKTEGFVFILLVIGCYSGIIGSNILLKEENDKTIEYLNNLPVERKDIVISKMFCGIVYIILMVMFLAIFNYIGLSISEKFDIKLFVLLSITPIFPSLVIYSLCMFLSTFTHKTKKMFGISIGIVFISYILQTISTLGESVEFFKYFSMFTLADVRNVITTCSIDIVMVIISILISTILLILTIVRYNKKELV